MRKSVKPSVWCGERIILLSLTTRHKGHRCRCNFFEAINIRRVILTEDRPINSGEIVQGPETAWIFSGAPPFVFWLDVCSGLRRSTLASIVVAFHSSFHPGRCSVCDPGVLVCWASESCSQSSSARQRGRDVVDVGFAPRSHHASRGHARILRVKEEEVCRRERSSRAR